MERRDLVGQVSLVLLTLGGGSVITALTLASEQPYRDSLLVFGVVVCVLASAGLCWLFAISPKAATLAPAPIVEKQATVAPPASPTVSMRAVMDELNYSDLALAKYGEDIDLPDSITPTFLFDLCKGKTAIQCEGAVAVYMGQRLKVSGTIFAASRMGASTTVSIMHPDSPARQDIYMIFEGDRERLGVMQIGDTLTATGRIIELGPSGMKLADCRLV